jgi:hypothetical protein
MTMGPGDLIWERFGHNAIGIRDREAGTDLVYNWGVFDFNEADFLPRFIRGEMRYRVEPYDAMLSVEAYRRANRSVWIQELNLTPAQRLELKQFVEWNALDENKYYRYDYFGDNCSTRVRDVLDRALGGVIRQQFGVVGSGRTFRDEARRLADADVLYTGIDIGLGSPSDREMTQHEAMFVPMRLRDVLRELQVTGADGQRGPVVASEAELFGAVRAVELAAPANYQGRYALIGGFIAAIFAMLGRRAPRAEQVVAVAWCTVVGLLGVLLVILWGFTSHTWAYQNVNLLVFNPLWWIVAWAVGRSRSLGGALRGTTGAVAALAIVGVVLGLLRWPQRAEHVALLVAAPHAWVLARLWRRAP